MGITRHIGHAEGWLVVATEPDFCRVGTTVVAFNSFAQLDHKQAASPNVKARSTPVYRIGDLFRNIQANAGAHIVSGTSLCTGYVQILDGHPNVKVNAIPVARHDSRCRINCDIFGVGGALGRMVTMTKTVAPTPTASKSDSWGSPGAKVSKRLLAMKAARDKLIAGRFDIDSLDELFNFDSTNSILDGLIGEISGTPGTAVDWGAQGVRGVLGGVKGLAMGISELAYEGMKGVPKLLRYATGTESTLLDRLNREIADEEIRLGNVAATSIGEDALNLGKGLVKPLTDPWTKGQRVEAVSRGLFEALTFASGWLKAGKVIKARKLMKLAKADEAAAAAAAAAKAAADKAAAAADAAAKAAGAAKVPSPVLPPKVAPPAASTGTTVATPAATAAPTVSGGVYIARVPKRARPAANGFDKPDGYTTHGIYDSPLHSPEGRKVVESYRAQGLPPGKAMSRARELMESGSTLPKAIELAPGDALYKVVPEGKMPGQYSAYFATKDEISALKGMSYDQISDRIGIPLESQQTLRFDVVEIKATKTITVFESIIASTTQNGYAQPGGGIQTLITNRGVFTDPKLIGKLP